ncbi:MAG: undecaprenyl-diphosphatase UppP [Candidatus Pacebacteria bacterium]|nr:undecaprenyl-diphosphatase UppP [Candidatus Paceibacterota bacterium]MCF7862527.1 undecaprenyl-diphosphatase UppP [Candidatus Paceibacterota bacterium]
MNFLDAILFGIVEGITEFLPISSTAHLEITRFLIGLPATSFLKTFEITIQLGAILAVVFLYRKKLLASVHIWRQIIVAFIPTGVIGFALYKIIKSLLLGNILLASVMLVIGGVVILFFERMVQKGSFDSSNKTIDTMTSKDLLILGATQALAVVPGVSRSGAVIIAGRVLGLSKDVIAEFSFLLAIPTMFSATVFDLYKSGFSFSAYEFKFLSIGFLVSFAVALFVVKWLINYIKNHSFSVFGWYRIVVGIILLIVFFI